MQKNMLFWQKTSKIQQFFWNEIKNTKLEKSDFDIKFPKLQWAIEEFEKTFTESNLKLNFDKICVINSNDKFVDLDNPKIIAIENFDLSSALKAYKSSPFYIQKRRFWKWAKEE